jgi:hypothetical protein
MAFLLINNRPILTNNHRYVLCIKCDLERSQKFKRQQTQNKRSKKIIVCGKKKNIGTYQRNIYCECKLYEYEYINNKIKTT